MFEPLLKAPSVLIEGSCEYVDKETAVLITVRSLKLILDG